MKDHFPGGAAVAWRAGDPAPAAPPGISGKALTAVVALRLPPPAQAAEIVCWTGKGARIVVRLALGLTDSQPALIVEFATDARDEPLRLSMPLAALGEGGIAVIALRFSGLRLELFADGVLVDEEWPMGSLPAPEGRLRIGTAVDRLALWNRALTDDELIGLAGGAEGLAARELRILGPPIPVGQFWRPRGFNTNVGDCMPFFHDGRFHLFYLFNRRNHMSRWGLGGHEWAHMSTADLIHWVHHPTAVPLTHEAEGSMCTGSLFFHDRTYYAFYAVRTVDRSASPLCASTSADCINFTKHPPLAVLTAPYKPEDGRDPVVFRDSATGSFHMLVTTALADPSLADLGGCLAHLVSRDLRTWEQRGPFIVPGLPGQPECPDTFEWRGWHYLLFSNLGVTRYRMSRSPLGPWERPTPDGFGGPDVMVMKTAAFTGDRRIGAAFTREAGYGGKLVFREILQHADGTLGSGWPVELPP
jgi:beta-fructofuranosidase